jgi:DNA repair protein RadC
MYPTQKERIFGLSGLEAARRKKLCASHRAEWAYLRLDPCLELKEGPVRPVASSSDAYHLFRDASDFAGRGKEHFLALCLDSSNQALGVATVAVGGRKDAYVDPVMLLQPALLVGASALIVGHNHPSGSLKPSDADLALTKHLAALCKEAAIPLFDHLVLTEEGYFSLRDGGLF